MAAARALSPAGAIELHLGLLCVGVFVLQLAPFLDIIRKGIKLVYVMYLNFVPFLFYSLHGLRMSKSDARD